MLHSPVQSPSGLTVRGNRIKETREVSQEQSDTGQQHQAQTTAAMPEQAHGKAGVGAEQMHQILEI